MSSSGISLAKANPELCLEWHPTKNLPLTPDLITYGARSIVWWICLKYPQQHQWKATPNSRTNRNRRSKSGCPFCLGARPSFTNILAYTHPHLAQEWDCLKNQGSPETVTFGSNTKVWWKCANGHEWQASPNSRVRPHPEKPRGCRRCYNLQSPISSLPDILLEWDFSKNQISPNDMAKGSHKNAWWLCSLCNYSWQAPVHARACNKTGCPSCSSGARSKVCAEWLDGLGIKNREVRLTVADRNYRVDGYESSTRTIYEFLGDYWHGNPAKYPPDAVNKNLSKTFGSLFQTTLQRLHVLTDAGYVVKYVWERDYRSGAFYSGQQDYVTSIATTRLSSLV